MCVNGDKSFGFIEGPLFYFFLLNTISANTISANTIAYCHLSKLNKQMFPGVPNIWNIIVNDVIINHKEESLMIRDGTESLVKHFQEERK